MSGRPFVFRGSDAPPEPPEPPRPQCCRRGCTANAWRAVGLGLYPRPEVSQHLGHNNPITYFATTVALCMEHWFGVKVEDFFDVKFVRVLAAQVKESSMVEPDLSRTALVRIKLDNAVYLNTVENARAKGEAPPENPPAPAGA